MRKMNGQNFNSRSGRHLMPLGRFSIAANQDSLSTKQNQKTGRVHRFLYGRPLLTQEVYDRREEANTHKLKGIPFSQMI